MATTTLQKLTTSAGLAEMRRRVGAVHSFFNEGAKALKDIKEVAKREIAENPELAKMPIHITKGMPGGYYYTGPEKIQLGVINPAVLAHELGHARSIRDSRIYKGVQRVSSIISRLNMVMGMPIAVGLASIKDAVFRNKAYNTMMALSLAADLPTLLEEAAASTSAMKYVPKKGQGLKTLLPAYATYLLSAGLPLAAYQAVREIEDSVS